MTINKLILKMVVLAYFIALIVSCSAEELAEDYTYPETSINLSVVQDNDWEMSNDIFNLINQHRTDNDLPVLLLDSTYASAYSVQHTKYMIETQTVNHHNFFIRSNGLKQRGAIAVSENVAYAYSSAHSVVNAWLNSEGHKENIEGDFTHIGFGVIKSETENRYYFTTLFYN